MNEKRFEVIFYGDVINCVRDENGKEYNLHELIDILMNQQDTIRKLRNENIISKNQIEDLRGSLFILNKELERQMQKSDLDE